MELLILNYYKFDLNPGLNTLFMMDWSKIQDLKVSFTIGQYKL